VLAPARHRLADVEVIDAAIPDGLAPRWLAVEPFATADLGGRARSRAPRSS